VFRRDYQETTVVIKTNSDGLSYADVIKRARREVDLGIANLRLRRANGGILVEIPGPEGIIKADSLASCLRKVGHGWSEKHCIGLDRNNFMRATDQPIVTFFFLATFIAAEKKTLKSYSRSESMMIFLITRKVLNENEFHYIFVNVQRSNAIAL